MRTIKTFYCCYHLCRTAESCITKLLRVIKKVYQLSRITITDVLQDVVPLTSLQETLMIHFIGILICWNGNASKLLNKTYQISSVCHKSCKKCSQQVEEWVLIKWVQIKFVGLHVQWNVQWKIKKTLKGSLSCIFKPCPRSNLCYMLRHLQKLNDMLRW